MSSGAKETDQDHNRPLDTPDPDSPTNLFADATTVGLSKEEQAELLKERDIGPYRIIRQIGAGGMGAVYLAERDDDQYRKQVAIKLIKRGMDTEFVVRRFRNERQILASLDHPNIARLLDGGTTEDGRPYFVMEYIEGKPIGQYADEQKLSTVGRLNLFRKVCAAIHYAHQNLVIHRDIKPSNILVTSDGEPKLLDFGIAKLLNPESAGRAMEATATMVRLMTPEYASPEQVKGEPITTATDIYSLGVVLYELLTGHRPYRLTSRTPQDIARVVCEAEPQRPSTAIARVETVPAPAGGDPITLTPETVSSTRDGNPEKLRRRLRGDLDNIVLMAMRKEPQRRYASVDQFSNDLSRHLEGRPVIARNDTMWYRGAKFIRRNKAAVIAAILILATLVGGIIATSIQRARAERLFNDVRALANSFMFEIHDAIEDLPGATPARELVVKRALEYLDSLSKEAGGDASLQRELGTAYQKVGDVQGNPYIANLGDTAGALESYRKSLAIREKLVANDKNNRQDRRDLAVVQGRLGDVLWSMGDTKPALEAYHKAIAGNEALVTEDTSDTQSARNLWIIYRKLGYAQGQAGDFNAAYDSFRKASALNEKLVAANPNDPQARRDMSINYSSLGEVAVETGDLEGGLENFRKALAIDEEMARAEPTNAKAQLYVLIDYGNIGDVLMRAKDFKGALESFRTAQPLCERLAAADPANAQTGRNCAIFNMKIGITLAKMDDHKGALESLRKATPQLESLPQTDPSSMHGRGELSIIYSYMGLSLAKAGDPSGAVEYSSKGRAIAEELMAANPDNMEIRGLAAFAYSNLGDTYATIAGNKQAPVDKSDSWREARGWYQKSLEIFADLKSRNAWVSPDYGSLEEAQQKIAQSDAALAGRAK